MSVLGTVMPSPVFYGWDANGDPLNGGLLYTYAAGTSTPATTYQNDALTVPNTNPVVLNSAGWAVVYLAATTYKFVLTSATGTIMWTRDGVSSTALSQSITGIGGVIHTFGGSEYTPVTATSYPSGTTYDKCHADTAWLTIDSAYLIGSFAIQGMLINLSGGGSDTITAAIVNLSDGAPDSPLATISSVSTTGALVVSSNITFATAGSPKTYAIKTEVASGAGTAFGIELVRTA